MKTRLILLCTLVAISLCLGACSPTTTPVAIDFSCDDFTNYHTIGEEVTVAIDDSFTVTLCSNPTTGFQWSGVKISDQAVIEQVDYKFVPPEYTGDSPPAPGSPGKEVWTFKSLKQGESTISMEYSQPWEGGMKAAWTFVLTVVVK